MYDTIFLKYCSTDKAVDYREQTAKYLDANSVSWHRYGGVEIVSGGVGRLKVLASRNKVKINGGSLCKWQLGDNYQEMGRKDTQRAIERLSDILHLPLADAVVTRMDVGLSIEIKHPPKVYMNHLGEYGKSIRLEQPNSVYYRMSKEELCFYDKRKETLEKGEDVPDLFVNSNVLRYEQRYKKSVGKAFGRDVVTASLLYDEEFYISVLDRWANTYDAIEKINDITINLDLMKGVKGLNRMGILSLVEKFGGELALLKQIDEQQLCGKITPKQAFDLRKAIKNACNTQDDMVTKSEVITELDAKIKDAIRYYR